MNDVLDVLRTMNIFSGFSDEQLAILEPLVEVCDCRPGEVIFEQDAPADYLYIVIEGLVAIIYKPEDGTEITVAQIKPDGVFGWSAAFGSGIYTSGAVCRSDSRFLRIRGEDLKQLRHTQPETGLQILRRLARVVANRLRETHWHEDVVAMLEDGLTNGVKPIGG
ncbi:MAG: Crp/Fnr family transcriptional regulator [Anaerolineae bacterium]|nr:MAG: Crp/Fnr family transcriptional regulator [Anaerolineae bacterium]